MALPGRSRGLTLLLATIALALAFAAIAMLSAIAPTAHRNAESDRALAQAREALVAYAADRDINAWVGPGYLPCPDLDDDGWAEATCGSQGGDTGQAQRLGRLPWKTLGLPDLRDGHGERLWYAVSSKHKGLLNCAPSRACLDMSPDAALGTISVRDAHGTLVHDGTSTDLYSVDRTGAAAVIIAPGPPLVRVGAPDLQRRDGAAKADPANYLDKAPADRGAEDNADFVDRNDPAGRAGNTNGFIQGPVFDRGGRVVVNDRVAAIGHRDLMPRVMRRVALEVAQCLRFYASRPENGGRYPRPAPACRQALPDPATAWADARGALFGRVPDTPFARAREESGGRMLERWWRHASRTPESLAELPTRANACRIAFEPDDEGPSRRSGPGTPSDEGRTAGLAENAWWNYWKPFVFYALAPDFAPDGSGQAGCDTKRCIEVRDAHGSVIADGKRFAIIVSGTPLDLPGLAQRHGAAPGDARHWLEGANAALEGANPHPAAPECRVDAPRPHCEAPGCLRVRTGAQDARFNDVLAIGP